MRNRLVHAYFEVNTDILWNTLHSALPDLLEGLRAVPGIDETSETGP